MKNKIKYLILTIVIILISIASFFIGLNFYNRYDVNRDGIVDIKDLLGVQKYIINQHEKEAK